ncbi:MAG TPA: ATP-binding protein, partial [Steroidobacteraceae bacterium]|nr:ATP-binding protein [Steroidobacteraceae bacterium]
AGSLRERAESMSGLIDDTMEAVREIVSRLRPDVLDQLGLASAIEWQAEEFQRRSGLRCHVTLPAEAVQLDKGRSTALFRIFQELLTNVARHANATRVAVAVRPDSGRLVVLTVEDNGRGIDEEVARSPKSLGLMGVRERVLPYGGRVEVEGVRGKGTLVRVTLPQSRE